MFSENQIKINLDNFDDYNMANVWFRQHILTNNLCFTIKHKVSSTFKLAQILESLKITTKSQVRLIEEDRILTYAHQDFVGMLIISDCNESEHIIYISTVDQKDQEPFTKIIKAFPKQEKKNDETPVTFMYATETRIVKKTRNIAVPTWDEIEGNYSKSLSKSIKGLLDLKPPINHGKIILWHGQPGTGKSHALRSLLRSWKWCDSYYIIDPEALFRSPAYLMDILFENKESDGELYPGEPIPSMNGRWKLFVMEDADEFLTSDAKLHQGQNISRLLNLSDGLSGQGLNVLLLFTTNEPIERLHPAIIRAGRCLADIEFSELNNEESIEWLVKRGVDQKIISEHKASKSTLADLYAKLNKMNKIHLDIERPRIGF